jgi:hypothetical protein
MPLWEAGPFLAVNGVPVFPCVAGGKVPLVRHGLADATVDGRVAERWWRRWPQANVGVPTGLVSGCDVVDVDVRVTGSGFEAFDRAGTCVDAGGWVMRVVTPSGGVHVYYPTDPGRPQHSWVCGAAHVDFRGCGGAVVVPPSVGVDGHGGSRRYVVAQTRATGYPVDANRLREALDPRWARRRIATRLTRMVPGEARVAALRSWVASRQVGERNAGLFWAACRLAETGFDYAMTMTVLSDPARQCGLAEPEIMATIRSALRTTSVSVGRDGGWRPTVSASGVRDRGVVLV